MGLATYPSDALPSGTNDNGVQVHSNHRDVTGSITLDLTPRLESSDRVLDADVATNVPEWDTAEDAAPDETAATADLLSDEESKSKHPYRPGDSVDAGAEEFGIRAGNTKTLEDPRRVLQLWH